MQREINMFNQPNHSIVHGKCALYVEEEKVICNVVLQQANFGKPLARVDIEEVFQTFVGTLPIT